MTESIIASSIIIDMGGALGIMVTLALGFFGIWRSSSNAHTEIRERLARIETKMEGRE